MRQGMLASSQGLGTPCRSLKQLFAVPPEQTQSIVHGNGTIDHLTLSGAGWKARRDSILAYACLTQAQASQHLDWGFDQASCAALATLKVSRLVRAPDDAARRLQKSE